MREFRDDARHGKVTSTRAFVNSALRNESLATLDDDEAKELAIA